MNAVPYYYIRRNLWTRKLTTLLTAGGMALVVLVFAAVLMLAEGLEQTLVATGLPGNVLVIRDGAETEVQSAISREQAALIEALPQIATGANGRKQASKEAVVLMVLPKRGTAKPSNVTLRGLSAAGLALRPQVRLIAGRPFRPGSTEIIAGNKIAQGFFGAGLGERLRFAHRDWSVVGVFDAGQSGFGSEVWADVDQLMQSFRRADYSAVLFRLSDPGRFRAARKSIQADQRLKLEAKREVRFYAEQSEVMANFLDILGTTLSVIFSIGAILGAMITMYASVAARTAEIGTLRALGYSRLSILRAFLAESLLLGLAGGLIGLALASSMQFITVSTMNWQTFSELAFSFTLSTEIAVSSLCFALSMGFLGGLLPAFRASRLRIVEALRSA